LKAILDNVTAEMRMEMKAANEKIFDRISKAGNEVHHLTPEETAAWKKALQSLFVKYGPEIGESLIENLQKEIAKFSK